MKITIFLFLAVTLLASLAAVSYSSNASRQKTNHYNVTGRIISIDSTEKTIRISHDEIPDYMPAMTMPFTVKDASLLQRAKAGDSVAFRLEVTETDSWISRLEKIENPTPFEATAISLEISADISERLEIGEKVPDLSLVNQNGNSFRLHEFRGKAILLTFIYTRCPLPNFCPLLSENFAELQKRLDKEFPGKVQLISLTIDPAFDTPEVLKSYAKRYRANENTWTFATGSVGEINRAGGWFNLHRESNGGVIDHDLRTALISPDGKLLHVWKSNFWTPYELQRSVREALTGRVDVARK